MLACAKLALTRGTRPVGLWTVDLDSGWHVVVNATFVTIRRIPAWHGVVFRDSVPVVLFDAIKASPLVPLVDDMTPEDAALAALTRAATSPAELQQS